MEAVFEEDSQLRRCIENELLSEPTISPDQALKVEKKHKNYTKVEITGLPLNRMHKTFSVSEPEGAAQTEVAGSPISAAAAGVPLGMSGRSHTA